MVLGYLLLAGAAYFAYRTNPDPKTFRTFLENDPEKQHQTGGRRKSKGFFSKLLAPLQKHSVPNYRVDTYGLFSIATVCDSTGAMFLGVFGTWWFLTSASAPGGRNVAVSGNSSDAAAASSEERAAQERQKAVNHKVRKDYRSAAAAFYNAGRLLELASREASSTRPGSGDFETHEAATAFEEASKCYHMCNEEERAAECIETAAKLFRMAPRSGSRAARLYDSLGELYRKPDPPNLVPGQQSKSMRRHLPKAVCMFKEAAELYEAEGDGRYIFSLVNVAATQADLGAYTEAVETYERILPLASLDSALQFNVRKYAFNACVCALAASGGDWVDLERRLVAYGDAYPALFRDSREFAVLEGLAAAVRDGNDADAFADRCREYDALSPLEPWVIKVFLEQKKKLESGGEDLR